MPLSFRLLVLLLMVCLHGGLMHAQEGTVAVRSGGRPIFRVGDLPELPAAERARRIERRITALLSRADQNIAGELEIVSGTGNTRAVTLDGLTVATVHASDAEEQMTDLDELARQWAAAIEREWVRARRERSALSRLGDEITASIRGAFSRLQESSIRVVPSVLAAVLVLLLFWLLARSVRLGMRLLFRQFVRDLTVENLIKQIAYYSVWMVGLLVAAGAVGFEPAAVVTGLGLTSLALGFALKDILSNFVSGLLILLMRPFELGDQIVVGNTEGAVEKVDLRATHIRAYDGRLALVPNSEVFTSRVINNTAAPLRRGAVRLAVGHPRDLAALAEVIRRSAHEAVGIEAHPPVTLVLAELAKDDVVLEVRYWTDSRRSDFVAATSSVLQGVYRALSSQGIYPTTPNVRILVPGADPRWREILRPAKPGGQRTPEE